MPTIVEERQRHMKAAEDIVGAARAAVRNLTDDEKTTLKEHLDTVTELDTKIKKTAEDQGLLDQLNALGAKSEDPAGTPAAVSSKSLGEHFAKSEAFKLAREKRGTGERYGFSAPEFKAATDPLIVNGNGQTQYGQVVPIPLRRLTVADLFSSGNMDRTTLTYWTQGAVTGAFAATAENTLKPSLNFAFTQVVENLTKIAGITKVTDEAIEDTPYIESVVNSQLLLRLKIAEEDQLLSGTGTAPQLMGILNRSGVQTESAATAADNLDALFRALTKVQTATFLPPDAVVMHPTDYQKMRLSKDLNGQYFGGGPFTGAYGEMDASVPPAVGMGAANPGVWGYRTVVTPAIAAGTALVGAFQPGGQVFRKGGVRVESTNSNEDDFKYNRIAIRAEERLLLAVYFPAAFVKVTLL